MRELIFERTAAFYAYLKAKKLFGKIFIGLIALNLLLPSSQTNFITWAILIAWGFGFVVTHFADGAWKDSSAKCNVSHGKPFDDFTEDNVADESDKNSVTEAFVVMTQSRITALLDEELGETEWTWGTEYTPREYALYLHNGNYVRVFLKDSEFDAADIAFHPYDTIELINFTAVWFKDTGRDAIAELVYAANSQGVKKLVLSTALIPAMPEKDNWEELCDILESEGYKASIVDSGIELTWPRKKVKKLSEEENE